MHWSKKIVATAVIGLGLAGCADDNGRIGGSGLMEATSVTISAETAGRILSLSVDEGDRVSANDTMAVIDPSHLQLKLVSAHAGKDAAEASLETAALRRSVAQENVAYLEAELHRISNLVASGSGTSQQVDKLGHELEQARLAVRLAASQAEAAKAELNRLQAEIDQLYRYIEDCYPRAHAHGVVIEKFVESGELVGPGKALVTVARLDTMWVKVYLPAPQLSEVRLGDKATVDTEAGPVIDGRVIWISDQSEFTPKNVQTAESRANLVYAVKVQVANPERQLKIGMPVYVTLEDHESD